MPFARMRVVFLRASTTFYHCYVTHEKIDTLQKDTSNDPLRQNMTQKNW